MARWQLRRASIGWLVTVALVAASTPSAHADGDPASDYLTGNQVFLTSLSAKPSPADRRLLAVVRAANRAGFPVRVAVISSEYDLGSITALWRKPRLYAEFLGTELSAAYRQRLLVVMPNGFGFNWPGHSAASEYQLLAGVSVGGASDPAAAAVDAVQRLAAVSGVALGPSTAPRRAGGGAGVPAVVLASAATLLLLGAGTLVIRRSRWRPHPASPRPHPASPRPHRASPRPHRASPRPHRASPRPHRASPRPHRPRFSLPAANHRTALRWTIPGVAVLGVAAVATPILALRRSPAQVSPASVVTPPPFSWAADRRPAPEFVLRDQDGRPVSVASYRGRPLIVTFIDPLCRNLCPLEAQVLNQMERQLPAAQRPAILAVSVDRWADTRADLLQDVREWHLVPEWRWAVGAPAQLAKVWNQYGVGVQVTTKHIANTTITYITHTEAAYVVDASGHERALFLWPFYPQDVTRVLRQIG